MFSSSGRPGLKICCGCGRSLVAGRRQFQSLHAGNDTLKKPQIIFSGIQPTGVPHLGNYLGALRNWVRLEKEAAPEDTILYSLVDLHAITVKQDPHQLRQWRKEMLATLIAVGLNPKRSIIFQQSAVPAHSELMWILSCNASMGYLSRMTQWKSKLHLPENTSASDPSTKTKLKLGLFSYPVLQAADILVHRATHVPVGADQSQHLEFARECALGFNHLYGDVLVPPNTLLSPAKRIMSLTKPANKMSKSDADPKSRIMLIDSEEVIFAKIKSALTDSITGVSYDPEKRPGVSNLLEIMFHLKDEFDNDSDGPKSVEELAKDCEGLSMKAFKEKVAETVDFHLCPVRDKYEEVMEMDRRHGWLKEIAEEGAAKANKSAGGTMKLVRDAIGF